MSENVGVRRGGGTFDSNIWPCGHTGEGLMILLHIVTFIFRARGYLLKVFRTADIKFKGHFLASLVRYKIRKV